MDYHHHARLTIYSREVLARDVLEGGLSLRAAAAACRLSRQSAAKWVRRFQQEGVAGLRDSRSRPHPRPGRVALAGHLRPRRGPGVPAAQPPGLSRSTVSRILPRLRLNKARMLEP